MKKTFLIFIVIGAIVAGCSKEKRRYNRILGNYTLKEYTVDGVDSLNSYEDSLGLNYYFYHDDLHNENGCHITGPRNDGKETSFVWGWYLMWHGTTLQFLSGSMRFLKGPFGIGDKIDWEIMKLSNKEFIIKTTFNGKEYQMKYE